MNVSLNSPLTLDKAASILRKAQDVYQDLLLGVARELRSPAWNDAYYSSGSLKSFQRRFEAYRAESPDGVLTFEWAYNAVVAAWNDYETARLAEKARKAAKRAAVAAKRDLKAELNLQEGVSLKGVDVGQYKAILASLEPVRLHAYEVEKQNLKDELAEVAEFVAKNPEFPVHATIPAGSDRITIRGLNQKHAALLKPVQKWFELPSYGSAEWLKDSKVWAAKKGNRARIEKSAEQFALAYVQGYAAKLALKTGEWAAEQGIDQASPAWNEVHSCTVSSTDLWRNSVAEIVIASRKVRFHTQIIWNRSCLGKVFNQYPTRRVL